MTLCAAWIRHTPTGDQELVFATDSCLSAGERWEAGVKLFELPRKDCFICFAGETSRAYPMILNLIHSIEASPALKNPQTDLLDVLHHVEALFTDLAQAIDLSDLSKRSKADDDDARGAAKFLFGGWRWLTSEFYVWRLAYDPTLERFVAEPCFLDDSEPVCFIGDLLSDDLIVEIYEDVGGADIKLNMQPLKLLIRKIRDISGDTSGIRGAPQIGKVYRSGNSKLFGVMWQSIEGKPHYQSRPVLSIQNMVHQYFDPDTCELINDCPGRKPDLGNFLNKDEQAFISLCYNEDDDLKLDLNEFQRGKLQEILRQVAYKHFLNTVTMIEQPEVES